LSRQKFLVSAENRTKIPRSLTRTLVTESSDLPTLHTKTNTNI
jgi:hypothetical protein